MRSDVPESSLETGYSWLVMILSMVMASLSFGAVTTVPILMQPMAEQLGWARSTLGLAHALAMIGAGGTSLLIGYLADRRGFAVIALVAAAATGFGLWMASRAQLPWQLYAPYALLVGAIGQGTFFGPITANVTHWFDRNRAFAMAVVMCGQSVGGLTIPVALRGLAQAWGWRDAMATYALVCLVCISLCALVFLRAPPRPAAHAPLAHRGPLPEGSMPVFFGVCAVLMFLNTASFMVIAHLVAYGEELGLSPVRSASLLALLLGMTLISRLFGGTLIDRDRTAAVLFPCALMIPLGTLILTTGAGVFPWMLCGAVLFGFGYGGVFPVFAHLIRAAFPASVAGTWISAMFLSGFLAAALGSWSGGYLRDRGGDYTQTFLTSATLGGIALVLSVLLLRGVTARDGNMPALGKT